VIESVKLEPNRQGCERLIIRVRPKAWVTSQCSRCSRRCRASTVRGTEPPSDPGRFNPAESVHEAVVVVPGHPGRGGLFEVG